MTDYHPLLVRAIAGLEKNTGEARRALYERARTALLAQLRGVDPPLSEAEVTRERLALEEAVRKVEADAARQLRGPPQRTESTGSRSRDDFPTRDQSSSSFSSRSSARPAPTPRETSPNRPPTYEGVKGFRDIVAETESLGGATAQAGRSAREAYAAVPTNDHNRNRLESQPEPEWLAPDPTYAEAAPVEEEERPRRRVAGPMPRRAGSYEEQEDGRPDRARRGVIAAIFTVLIIASLGGAAYWQRERISGLFGVVKGLAPQGQRDQAQTRPKDSGRLGQDGQPASSQPGQQQAGQTSTRPGAPVPAVAQRVVLYEEDPSNADGNRHVGSALWRTETISPGPGLSPELAIRADVEVPERRLAMTMSIRRNTDQALPASHTVEIMFNLPADFAFGGVGNVPGLLMKEGEQARGAPLSGLAVKVTNNFFLIGLSAVDADLQRNLQLLRERLWFDIPIVYNNGRRAILAIEKGNPGERAFNDAFAAWSR